MPGVLDWPARNVGGTPTAAPTPYGVPRSAKAKPNVGRPDGVIGIGV